MSNPIKMQVELFRKYLIPLHVEMGRMYGFPECCIKQFAEEQVLGLPSYNYRQVKHEKPIPQYLGYVPCDECMKRY